VPSAPPVERRRHARSAVAAHGRTRRRGDTAIALAGVGLGACVGMGVVSVRGGLALPGGPALALGTLCALAGTYLSLVLLLLVSRLPWLEREVGHDRMIGLHRRVAPYALGLVLAHVALTTVSYAESARTSFLGELWTLVTTTAWMMPAAAAFVVMMGMGLLSYRGIRRRLSYETWWVAHLYFYLAVALAFGHQVAQGPMFAGNDAQRWFWTGLYLGVATAIVVSRVLGPLRFSARHALRVAAVVPEEGGAVSVYLSGRDLDEVAARGGQFFQWRFLTRELWWQAHPYSLSASPNPSWLRVTVKDLGDHSAALRALAVGTRVVAEGPYGVFTAGHRAGETVAAFAAGVGVTPVRALLEDLPADTDVTVVYRVAAVESAALGRELEELVLERGWVLHYLQGGRHLHALDAAYLQHLVPRLDASDVFVCGPREFTHDVLGAARAVGVPENRIHHEAFGF
jgi:predicted ferric reductase